MTTPTIVTFVVYLVLLLCVGLYFYWRSAGIEDYLLGGRGMGAWVTALSAQASDMSGWLLMGLPGAIYLGGLVNAWIAIGLFIGTALNWLLISRWLRVYTQRANTITLPSFLEERFADPTGLLRILSAIIILIANRVVQQENAAVPERFDEVIREVRSAGAELDQAPAYDAP